jgi:hypothetical protein
MPPGRSLPKPKGVFFDGPQLTAAPRPYENYALTIVALTNVAALAAAIAWLFLDPLAADAFSGDGLPRNGFASAPVLYHVAAVGLYITAALTIAALALGLFLGPPKHRGLRSWLTLTALVALWLGFVVSWREFAWAGQRWRLGRQIPKFEPVAQTLRSQWPRADGAVPGLGHFTASPHVEAKTLLIIEGDAPPGRAAVAAVEHSDAGALRFKLAGPETGAWLEWHPPADQPASFSSGLDNKYILDRTSPLAGGWFLSRYH